MRYKEWPFFPHWLEIFGKDRATGEAAEDVYDAASNMHNQFNTQMTEGVADTEGNDQTYVNLDDDSTPRSEQPFTTENGDVNSSCNKDVPQPSITSSKKRKHKADSSEPSVATMLSELCRTTGERLNTIASKMGYEQDLGQLRTQLFGLLSKLPGLSLTDRCDAIELIGSRNDRLEIFMGLSEEARAVYAARLLERERA